MTTKTEIGEMLIIGKTIEESLTGRDNWFPMDAFYLTFDIESCEYRLAPTTMYYRVYQEVGSMGLVHCKKSESPFVPWPEHVFNSSGELDSATHLFDHEVTE